MTLQNAFGNIALDATSQEIVSVLSQMVEINQALVLVLTAMAEKMPRVTGTDQMAVSIEAGSVGIAAAQTLATLTTLGTINAVGGKMAVGDNMNMAGLAHIYNNIKVT